jgi:hypothetical protein
MQERQFRKHWFRLTQNKEKISGYELWLTQLRTHLKNHRQQILEKFNSMLLEEFLMSCKNSMKETLRYEREKLSGTLCIKYHLIPNNKN